MTTPREVFEALLGVYGECELSSGIYVNEALSWPAERAEWLARYDAAASELEDDRDYWKTECNGYKSLSRELADQLAERDPDAESLTAAEAMGIFPEPPRGEHQ